MHIYLYSSLVKSVIISQGIQISKRPIVVFIENNCLKHAAYKEHITEQRPMHFAVKKKNQ